MGKCEKKRSLLKIYKKFWELREEIEKQANREDMEGLKPGWDPPQQIAAELSGDIFEFIGPRTSAEVIFWLAGEIKHRSEQLEDRNGWDHWEAVQKIANARSCCSGSPLPLLGTIEPEEI